MKTQNLYLPPVNAKYIQKIITSGSPAHRRYHSDEHNEDYNSTHAIDFLCEINTPVKAALNGKVVHIQDGLTKLWNRFDVPPNDFMLEDEQYGNYVVLRHKNDELSIYSHLKPNEIRVTLRNDIKTGAILGYNGHTGWSIEPHLHFMVFRYTKPRPARDFESFETRWK